MIIYHVTKQVILSLNLISTLPIKWLNVSHVVLYLLQESLGKLKNLTSRLYLLRVWYMFFSIIIILKKRGVRKIIKFTFFSNNLKWDNSWTIYKPKLVPPLIHTFPLLFLHVDINTSFFHRSSSSCPLALFWVLLDVTLIRWCEHHNK